MDDAIKQIKQMLEILGFNQENIERASNEIFTAILEDVYYQMLSEDGVAELKELVNQGKVDEVKAIADKLNQEIFIIKFQESTQKITTGFLKQIIESCPEELLDELQTKIELIQTTFKPPKTE